MSKETVKIELDTLTNQVNSGMKKKELAAFYGISELQMGKALKEAGLKIRKFHTPAFQIVKTTAVDEAPAGAILEDDKAEEELVHLPGETESESTDVVNKEATWEH